MKIIPTFLSYIVGSLLILLSIWLYYILFLTKSPVVLLSGIIITTIGLLSFPFTYRKVKAYYCKSESDKGFKTTYIIIIFLLLLFTQHTFVSSDLLKDNLTKQSTLEEIDEKIIKCATDKFMSDKLYNQLGDFEDYNLLLDECLKSIKSL